MIIIPHMVLGTAIASRLRKVWLVFVLGLLSHYLLDFIPHWDYVDRVPSIANPVHLAKIGADFLIALGLIYLLTHFRRPNLLISGITGALLPDILNVVYGNFGLKFIYPLIKFHNSIHSSIHLSFWTGLLTMLPVLIISFLIIKPDFGGKKTDSENDWG